MPPPKLLFLILALSPVLAVAESAESIGIGLGIGYGGGIGANYQRTEGHQSYYMAGGLLAYVGSGDKSDSAIGLGVGWKHNGISNNGKHAIGLYLGTVAAESINVRINSYTGFSTEYLFDFDADFGKGWNLGVAPSIGRHSGEST